MTFLKAALNSQSQGEGGGRADKHPSFMKLVKGVAEKLNITSDMLKRPVNVGLLRRRGRSAPRSCRWRCCSRRSAFSTRPTPVLDIDALKVVSEGVNALRSPDRAFRGNHPLPAPPRPHRAGHRARAVRRTNRPDRRAGAGARSRKRNGLRGLCGKTRPPEGDENGLPPPFAPRPNRRSPPAIRSRGRRCPERQDVIAIRDAAFGGVEKSGPAAPPRRGLEVYRPARPAEDLPARRRLGATWPVS